MFTLSKNVPAPKSSKKDKVNEIVNKIVDDPESEYYHINKNRRFFWHSRSITISCKVRNKNTYNTAPEFAANIRAYIMKEEKYFLKIAATVLKKLREKDREVMKKALESISVGQISKKLAKAALGLDNTVSCRLLGYEVELFYLKCYNLGDDPAFMLRVLYHTRYAHLKLKKILERIAETNPEEEVYDLKRGVDFSLYLDKIRFL